MGRDRGVQEAGGAQVAIRLTVGCGGNAHVSTAGARAPSLACTPGKWLWGWVRGMAEGGEGPPHLPPTPRSPCCPPPGAYAQVAEE